MIKVEHAINEKTGVMAFSFETNNEAEIDVLDTIRTAFLGNFPRQGGFVNSRRLVMEVNPGKNITTMPTNAA